MSNLQLSDVGLGAWIVARRPPRTAQLDPFKPHSFFLEEERAESGKSVSSVCVLLTNKECPWRCLMCDLWKQTLTQPTPPGAIPAQILHALGQIRCSPEQIKLYNSGSFFDSAAIPVRDYPAIAQAVSETGHLIVESHPRLVGSRVLRFRELLPGSLEVAMGLETVHPEVLPKLNKKFELADFERATALLRGEGILVRAFVLIKPPFLDEHEAVVWAVKSAEFAFSCGANVVSLIPTRPGNGALDALAQSGDFSPPRLATLERSFELVLSLGAGRTFADTWNLELFSSCPDCLEERRHRLLEMNLTQGVLPPVQCVRCGGL